jgi:hypothetical protein
VGVVDVDHGSLPPGRRDDAGEFLIELISQLFHADVLITEQTERIEALEDEVVRLRASVVRAVAA